MERIYPVLADYARRCVGVFVTSVSCESAFAAYKRILEDSRQSLTEQNLTTMMLVKLNEQEIEIEH